MLFQTSEVLPEQTWVLVYFLLLVMFQNPVYCATILSQKVNIRANYVSYIFSNFSQAGLFVLWLLFADTVRARTVGTIRYHLPKILFGSIIFAVSLAHLTYQFPDIIPSRKILN